MDQNSHLPQNSAAPSAPFETITLGAGCFWCVEAVFEGLQGVHSAQSGYMGGHIKNPGYREVCTGRTGHAEVVQIVYDATVLSTKTLLEVFFSTHDPTTLTARERTPARSIVQLYIFIPLTNKTMPLRL
jgi:peptide-methionine (S)-S-oxide reductase